MPFPAKFPYTHMCTSGLKQSNQLIFSRKLKKLTDKEIEIEPSHAEALLDLEVPEIPILPDEETMELSSLVRIDASDPSKEMLVLPIDLIETTVDQNNIFEEIQRSLRFERNCRTTFCYTHKKHEVDQKNVICRREAFQIH